MQAINLRHPGETNHNCSSCLACFERPSVRYLKYYFSLSHISLSIDPCMAQCDVCSPGQYSSSPCQCLPCPYGTYSNTFGATSCLTCPTNQYSLTGATVCESCSAGQRLIHAKPPWGRWHAANWDATNLVREHTSILV